MSDLANKANEKAYDERARYWSAAMATNVGHKYLEKPAMNNQLPHSLQDKSILCIGVGSGEEIEVLLSLDPKKIVAIDLSRKLLNIAESRFPSVEFKKMDMMDLGFPDASFDFVYSSLAFHYSKDWDTSLTGVNRVLIKDGELLFSTHNPEYWGTKPSTGESYVNSRGVKVIEHRDTLPGGVDITYFNHRSPEMIDDALLHAGFTIKEAFKPDVIDVDPALLGEDETRKYQALKTKNAQSPLFYIVSAVKTAPKSSHKHSY